MAASATFALKAGVWFRRGRLFIVSPDSLAQRARCQAETPLIVLFRFLRPAHIATERLVESISKAGTKTEAILSPTILALKQSEYFECIRLKDERKVGLSTKKL